LVGTKCGVKRAKVSVKKRRTCSKYNFTGEYANGTPADAVYLPHVDRKTKKLLKRLAKMGVQPVGDDGTIQLKGDFYRQGEMNIPTSTANAGIIDPVNDDQKQRWVQATSAVDAPTYIPEEVEPAEVEESDE